ncbi:hypothetical protein QR680_012257 [Steinernema hermaphroditum]|uniref:Snurportin-1 n=1 Tax=Steinernema hermaphroditum TaxID=289476 RepID=A0AA39M0G5_9BILA|nr:hypothetical protein QR680_012257 [Steinernema hermaphroditum]
MDVEAVTDMMAADLSVAGTTSVEDSHPRYAMYKNEGKIRESQQRRRKEVLERQKESRFDYVNKLRKIAVGEELSDEEEHSENVDVEQEHKVKPKPYANRLMLSEWLVDIPEEDRLSGEWLMLPSPRGRRCLLVASGGVTSAYSKSGYRVSQFSSYLPGGSRHDSGCCTILDGIIDMKKKTFYALDLLMWKDNPLDSSDYACRHYLMESRLSENILLSEKSSRNPFKIVALPACKCTREDMESMMEQKINYFLDGLLFYHSQVLYSPGQNPLIGWLKPWMLPEILNINVPEKFMKGAEEVEQGGARAFIDKFNAEHNHHSMIHGDSLEFLGSPLSPQHFGMAGSQQSALLLRRQLAELKKSPVDGFSAGLVSDDDIYKWEVLVIGPPDTLYEGGFFKAILDFPHDYPQRPPKMRFISEIFHPNIGSDGNVCISILHEPGDDRYGYEKPEERWLPVHTVETILLSVISMLADPNYESPANVDAAKMQRENFPEFKKRVAACVRKSQEE